MDPDVLLCIEVYFEHILFLHYFYEVVEILCVYILDPKIVDNKGEGDGTPLMAPEAMGVWNSK